MIRRFRFPLLAALAWPAIPTLAVAQGPYIAERVTVVNLIPLRMTDEVERDAEHTLAINPVNPTEMIVSSLTPNPTAGAAVAPVFYSNDGGSSWDCRDIVPAAGPQTGDITVAFSEGGLLYSGILKEQPYRWIMATLRTNDLTGSVPMTTLETRDDRDQPHVRVTTSNTDRLFVGFKDRAAISYGGAANTSSVSFFQDGASFDAAFGHVFDQEHVDDLSVVEGLPAVKPALASGGRVYVAYYANHDLNETGKVASLVVVRDDHWGDGPASAGPWVPDAFCELTTSVLGTCTGPCCQPGQPANTRGVTAAANLSVPGFFGGSADYLGANELRGSALDIAVNPSNRDEVWIAYADVSGGEQQLRIVRSDDRGSTWTQLTKVVDSATNPALHIRENGEVGYLYQKYVEPSDEWETHFERTMDPAGPWRDVLLAKTPNSVAAVSGFFIGDYQDIDARGAVWYGVFSAANDPDPANFPVDVITYQRLVDTATQTLRDNQNQPVDTSIDPFFFKIEPEFTFIVECAAPTCTTTLEEVELPICNVVPCGIFDPLPVGCYLGPSCCDPAWPLCPPWHIVELEGLGDWEVEVADAHGQIVPTVRTETAAGIVLSFRPSTIADRSTFPYRLQFIATTPTGSQPTVVSRRVALSQQPHHR